MKRARVLLIAVPLIWILFHFLSGGAVLTPGNLVNLFKYLSVVGILATGMTLVIGAGHIDLSVGSLLGFLGAAGALLLAKGAPLPVALLLGAGLGIALGMLHGALTAWFRVPSFIVTLASFFILRGATLAVARALTGLTVVGGLDEVTAGDPVATLFTARFGDFRVSIVWWIAWA